MTSAHDQHRERIEHFKRKFGHLPKLKRVKEYVRYERAQKGDLEHNFPEAFVDAAVEALRETLEEDYKDDPDSLERILNIARRMKSEPFMPST